MATIIDMPKLSDTMTVGTLVRWLKNEGDTVTSGDMIAEVETDKATMELENFEDGVLLKCYIPAGSEVPVGASICAIGEAGEELPEASEAPKAQAAPAKEEAAVPVAAPVAPAAEVIEQVQEEVPSGRIKASPLARKLAKAKGLKLEQLKGTGPDGRIVKADVLKGPVESSKAAAPSKVPEISLNLEAKVTPVSNMRAAIARVLSDSKSSIPHFYLDMEVDMAALITARSDMNAYLASLPKDQGGGVKYSVNDLVLKATAMALVRVPEVNASWQGDKIVQHGSVDVSFGVAVDEGLVTPVIRNSHEKSLREIHLSAKDLIKKARSKKLTPNEMTGSTFTVTNLGMYGITNFLGIINPPNAGILSVGASIKKPVVDASGNIVVGNRMMLGFSGDHRVIDGAVAASFLGALKEILEAPSLLLL